MGKKSDKEQNPVQKKLRPATTPEARENQLIALAVDLAEKQLMEGTASSQVITHYLKLGSTKKLRPATTPEARENQLIALAVDLAEKQLMEGTASSQVITHYLKLGSTKEKIEKEILQEQKKLVQAKTENLQSAKRIEELYTKAIDAMKNYSGQTNNNDEYDDYED